jgi:oligopeptide/dipeptide ABC transporter ATP-binding protein
VRDERVDRSRLLEVEDLVVRFPVGGGDVVHAVEGVSFGLGAGETLGIVGESGSGKSTLGFTILRRHAPVSGRVIFEGAEITDVRGGDLRRLRRKMQMVFQDPYSSLNPRMKVGEIVAEPLIVHDVEKRGPALTDRVHTLLEQCGLPASAADRYPNAFSGGERQRIAIARALALRPRLIVADEAVSALDVSIQAQIINLLRDLQEEEGLSYLFISHDLAIVRHIAHRILIMYAGKVMELGPSDAIFERPVHPYTHALLSAAPVADPVVERRRERIVLRGEVPSVLDPPRGCPFASRCALAVQQCAEEAPPLELARPGRLIACWRAEEAESYTPAQWKDAAERKLGAVAA